jgi:hypothetical protein
MTNITLRELGYDIMELYRANIRNDDEVDIRQIYYWIHTTRAKLLKQKLDKPFTLINNSYIQYLPALEMQSLDASMIVNSPSGRYYSSTVLNLPFTLERNNYTHTYVKIGPPDIIGEGYPIIRYEDVSTYGNGKFNGNTVAVFILGDRICLMSHNEQSVRGIKHISASGVFQNPMEAGKLISPTFSEDDNYPISFSMIDDMKSIIVGETNFKSSIRPPIDTEVVDQTVVNKQE